MLKYTKTVSVILSFLLINFTACAKPKTKEAAKPAQPAAEEKINPEIEKLNRVLLSMSPRCKAAIPNGNPEEFLADLKAVLATRSDFSADDLSPFYLIDKTHKVGADYEPKGLIHLEKNDAYAINKNNLSLRPEAYNALYVLAKAAKADGTYKDKKKELGELFVKQLAEFIPEVGSDLEVIDVATPCTYERYTGSYEGSWMSVWQKGGKQRNYPQSLDSVFGVYFAGQRIQMPGGLPIAVYTGRQAVQYLCRDFGETFV